MTRNRTGLRPSPDRSARRPGFMSPRNFLVLLVAVQGAAATAVVMALGGASGPAVVVGAGNAFRAAFHFADRFVERDR
jgi:hypothetical protein